MEGPESLFPTSDLSQIGIKAEFLWLQGHYWFGRGSLWLLLAGQDAGSSGSSGNNWWVIVVYLFHDPVHEGFCGGCQGCCLGDMDRCRLQLVDVEP